MNVILNGVLWITSVFLTFGLSFLARIHDVINIIRYKNFRRQLAYTLKVNALANDIAANVKYASMLNAWCIKKGGYHFGVRDETVSSALGKNQVQGTLTYLGLGLASLLYLIEKDHCYISINDASYFLRFPIPPKKEKLKITVVSLLVILLLTLISTGVTLFVIYLLYLSFT